MKKERINNKQRISNRELHQLLKLNDNDLFSPSIVINDKIIVDDFSVMGGLISKSIQFKDCIFIKNVGFLTVTFEKSISFEFCHFYDGFFTVATTFSEFLFLLKCKVKNNISLADSSFKLLVGEFSFCNKIIISGESKINNLSFRGKENNLIQELILSLNSIVEKFHISNLNIKKLEINSFPKGLNSDAELEIFNCKINSFYFNNISNNGRLILKNNQALQIKNESSFLTFDNSNLGEAEFVQFDFSSFSELNIVNSFIGDSKFINTEWDVSNINVFKGKDMEGYFSDRKYKKKWFKFCKPSYYETDSQLKQKKDVFKQIKYALSSQGDFVNEKNFHAL